MGGVRVRTNLVDRARHASRINGMRKKKISRIMIKRLVMINTQDCSWPVHEAKTLKLLQVFIAAFCQLI